MPTKASTSPSVGIFWGMREGHGPWVIVYASAPLDEAEAYGACLTYPGGHYDVWEGWRRLRPAELQQRGLPALIAWNEYEHFPRGRVVYAITHDQFTIYADRRLQAPSTISRIARLFGLETKRVVIRSDEHYRSGF